MLKKILVFWLITQSCVWNIYSSARRDGDELNIVTTLDDFKNVQEINQVALRAAKIVGMKNFYRVLSFHKIGSVDRDHYPVGTFVDTAAPHTNIDIDTLTNVPPLTQGYMLVENGDRSSCCLLSPFGLSLLMEVDTDLDSNATRLCKRDFFYQFIKHGLGLEFKHVSAGLDFSGKRPIDMLRLYDLPDISRHVRFSDCIGSDKYLVSGETRPSPIFFETSYYGITSVNGRKLPTPVFYPESLLPSVFRTSHESTQEELNEQWKIKSQHLLLKEKLEKQYRQFFKERLTSNTAASGGGSGEVVE